MKDVLPAAIAVLALVVIVVLTWRVHWRVTVAIERGMSWLIDRAVRLFARVTS